MVDWSEPQIEVERLNDVYKDAANEKRWREAAAAAVAMIEHAEMMALYANRQA